MKKVLAALGAFAGMLCLAAPAFAQEAVQITTGDARGWAMFGVMLGMGLASFGGALGQGKALSAALEGIARNPGAQGKVFMPMILGVAFIESLVIFSFLIAYFFNGKI